MNERISDWSVVNSRLYKVLLALTVPLVILIVWQLYISDKVVEVMRSNDLMFAAVSYFVIVAVEIGFLAAVLRVGRSKVSQTIFGLAVALLPFAWVAFGVVLADHGVGVFGLVWSGLIGYTFSILYSLVLLWLVYMTFALPFNINSGVGLKSAETSSLVDVDSRDTPKKVASKVKTKAVASKAASKSKARTVSKAKASTKKKAAKSESKKDKS